MQNPLTFRVEALIGSIFIIAFAGFMIGIVLVNVKNADSEAAFLNVPNASVKLVSDPERQQMEDWLKSGNIEIPKGRSTTRYLLQTYPDRPWLSQPMQSQ